jgi:hypothetical protein
VKIEHPIARYLLGEKVPDGSRVVRVGSWAWYRDSDGQLHHVTFADVILFDDPGSLEELERENA